MQRCGRVSELFRGTVGPGPLTQQGEFKRHGLGVVEDVSGGGPASVRVIAVKCNHGVHAYRILPMREELRLTS